uniref:Uncharacterized protein n=1 Tax=Anopheles quadriannulatus TaxID=34691 RepID=A0A182XHB8_ANOQN
MAHVWSKSSRRNQLNTCADEQTTTLSSGSSGLQPQQQSYQLQPMPSAQQLQQAQQQQQQQLQQQRQFIVNPFSDANLSNESFQNASADRGTMLPKLHPQIAQQPHQMQQQQQPFQPYHAPLYHDNAEKLSKAYSLPPSMGAAAKESLRKDLAQSRLEQQQQQHARKFQPVARAFIVPSSTPGTTNNAPSMTNIANQGNGSNIYTDIALGKTIQTLMKPTPILATAVANRLTGGSLTRSIGALGPCRELPEGGTAGSQEAAGYCRAASSLLGNFTGSNSVSACTVTHPHRCVQDLIKEELGANRLSKAGSMINMSTDSELFAASGSLSHPASGRSSPAFMHGSTPVGSPPRFVNTLGPAYGGGSAR